MMRILLFVATVAMTVSGAPAFAQSPLDGPLAEPGATAAPKPARAKPNRHKAAKTAHRAAPKIDDPSDMPTDPQPIARSAPTTVPNDPMSFGMKWNGSNDTARETRGQNYDGNAQGTGAEVGMKLHF